MTDGDGKFHEYSHEVISVQIRPFEELPLRRFMTVQTSDGLWLDIAVKDGWEDRVNVAFPYCLFQMLPEPGSQE